ncbi:hypothetical protein QEH52_02065 [Coraliomargarita sp. SDUM461003]|uniref:Uncharacterized protein n=1 Tax=Thalassobacterium maritimum TaxID=3041265 RepID=A0ABU1AQ23_9BACT|nr:hypothetical protein [Coraliomargarita sp. SDUM461003]MDQ8206276.1 hypothetical protein [Coraliomargarita sp. SDUM461003]
MRAMLLLLGCGVGWWLHSSFVSELVSVESAEIVSASIGEAAEAQHPVGDEQSLRRQMLEVLYAEELPVNYREQLDVLQTLAEQNSLRGRERLKFDALIRYLADQDPVGLYAWAESNGDLHAPYRDAILTEALRVMAVREPLSALKRVQAMHSYWHRKIAYQAVFAEMMMEFSPDRVLDLTLDGDLAIFEQFRYVDIALLIAKEQPDRVFDIIDERFPVLRQNDARLGALLAIAEEDFERAEAIAAGMAGDELALQAQQVLYVQILKNGDFSKADELFAQSGPSEEKDNALNTLAYDPRGAPLEQSIAFIKKYASPAARAGLTEFLYAQSVVDAPETIVEVLEQEIRPEDHNRFFNSLAWRVRDAGAFEQTYAALESSEFRSAFLNQYISSISYSAPSDAAELFLKNQSEMTFSDGVHQIATQLAKYGADKSLEFAAQIQDEGLQKKALEGVVDEWFGQNPEAAWNWLVEQQAANPDDVQFNQELQRRAIRALGENDALGAIEFVEAIENPEFQASVRQGVLPSLFQEDPEGAMTYIEEVTAPASLDATYQSLAKRIAYSTPDLALLAAFRVKDQAQVAKLSQQILKGWSARRSSAYIVEKLQQIDLSEAQKSALIDSL